MTVTPRVPVRTATLPVPAGRLPAPLVPVAPRVVLVVERPELPPRVVRRRPLPPRAGTTTRARRR